MNNNNNNEKVPGEYSVLNENAGGLLTGSQTQDLKTHPDCCQSLLLGQHVLVGIATLFSGLCSCLTVPYLWHYHRDSHSLQERLQRGRHL